MHFLIHPVPSQQHDPEEPGFEEKGGHDLEADEGAQHGARGIGEPGPIQPELKGHEYPGDDTDGKVQREDGRPKSVDPVIVVFSRPQIQGMNKHQEPRHADGDGGKDNMIRGREAKLKPG